MDSFSDRPRSADRLHSADRPRSRAAQIRCQDGNHTLELTDRELVAERLLRTSRKHSFDPDVDVDWDASQDPDQFYMPPQLVSLYETPLWEELTHRQRVELSKHEVCSMVSFGIWSELLLMQGLIQHAYRNRYDSGHFAYAMTEVADECRHSKMFGQMVRACGLKTHRVHRVPFNLGKALNVVCDPMPMFAGILAVEEFTDAFQRLTFPDEEIQPLIRQVARIHVIEEARHIKYAREELKRMVAKAAPARRWLAAYCIARWAWMASGQMTHPSCYRAVGLDPALARRVARHSPHRRATIAWSFRKCTAFFEEVGFLDGPARTVWVKSGLLTCTADS
ncbi:diiron oxygenase [Actinomadura fulvescens]|uniref:Diiron oxygenase n=1 Tax=Actinomadura fulvescens TaxID=46160 RepID=A0ABN3QZB0_9ACTN